MNLTYRLTWLTCRFILRGYCRARFLNPSRLPQSGPVILASNHASYLDPPLIGCGLSRPVNYLARDTLFHYRAFRGYLLRLNCVPVDRDGAGAAGLKGILDRLSAGGVILMFPEGTRSRDGGLQPARAGIGLAVIKSRATVLPVRVFGTFEAFSRVDSFPRPHSVAVKYGTPLNFVAEQEEARTARKTRSKVLYQEVADRIMKEIAHLQPCEDKEQFP